MARYKSSRYMDFTGTVTRGTGGWKRHISERGKIYYTRKTSRSLKMVRYRKGGRTVYKQVRIRNPGKRR